MAEQTTVIATTDKTKSQRSFVSVSRFTLIDDAETQADLVHTYAKRLAKADRAVDEAEAFFDLEKARLAHDMRSHPSRFGFKKTPAEMAIKLELPRQRRYKAAQAAVRDAKYLKRTYEAAVKALEHRKRMIEKLVDLHGQDYFATPRLRGQKSEEMRDEIATRKRRRARDRREREEDDE